MGTYAQIRYSRIRLINEYDTMPPWGVWVEITNEDPMPEVGWDYNAADGSFSEHVYIQTYSRLEWYRQFTSAERVLLETKSRTNDNVAMVKTMFQLADYIDKTDEMVVEAMTILVSGDVITHTRRTEIMD